MHSYMETGELSQNGSQAQHERMIVKEWILGEKLDSTADSRVVDWVDGDTDPSITKRYPWEGFYDVGFRTVMDDSSEKSFQ